MSIDPIILSLSSINVNRDKSDQQKCKYIEVVVAYSKAMFLHMTMVTEDQRIALQSGAKDANQQPPLSRYAVSLHRKFCGQRQFLNKYSTEVLYMVCQLFQKVQYIFTFHEAEWYLK